MAPIIALITDFGISDPYIASMKGIILGINPTANVVDLAHNLPKFNIRYASFILASAYKFFPHGTIFVGVVDPGVGSAREPIILKTKHYYFVGPNNGLFTLVAEEDGVEDIRVIENKLFMREKITPTFHGRDVFAPAAAMLSLGKRMEDAGPPLSREKFVMLDIGIPEIREGYARGSVLVTDSFGNIITNIRGSKFPFSLGERLRVSVGDREITASFARTYHDVPVGEFLVLVGSHEFVEIAINEGCAQCELRASEGAEVTFRRA